ncbi:hypothetical protein [uncultured Aquimarina sp.]|uniref:hypothetical protein n=1 Tax=uncultured Aquimarina sp. TaxID=575652 RepID=UPI002624F453|nr:hypothetical protein [uncultured Aquimarina sp.]
MKLNYFNITVSVFILLFSSKNFAQQSPIPVELFAGNRAITYQHVLNKNILDNKFNFFNVVSFDAEYEENGNSIYVVQSLVSYKITNKFSLGIGGQLQNIGAFAIVGVQFAHATDNFLLVILPTVTITGKTNYEQFLLLEYRPKINEKIRGYFRTQFLVNTDFTKYNRGYQQLRLGLEKKNIQFGLAATFDQFNSSTITTSNYGVFTRLLVF